MTASGYWRTYIIIYTILYTLYSIVYSIGYYNIYVRIGEIPIYIFKRHYPKVYFSLYILKYSI